MYFVPLPSNVNLKRQRNFLTKLFLNTVLVTSFNSPVLVFLSVNGQVSYHTFFDQLLGGL